MESNDGIQVTRRAMLSASTVASASLFGASVSFARGAAASQAKRAEGTIGGFQRFCERWLEIAEDYPERGLAQFPADEYIYRLCAGVSDLAPDDIPARLSTGWDKDGLKTGLVWAKGQIFVIEQELAPGAVLRAHNHPAFNAVTMVSKGSCNYRHFEPLFEAPDFRTQLNEDFPLQETRAGFLRPGRLTQLSRSRDNIHWFQAGDEGATLIDFSMGFGGDPSDFSALEFDPKPLDSHNRIYEGHWIGNPYK